MKPKEKKLNHRKYLSVVCVCVERVSFHHVYGCAGQVSLGHQPVLVGDIQAFLRQRLDDGVVAQQRFDGIAAEDQAPGSAVELGGLEQAGHLRLHVLLVVLVPVQRLHQFLWYRV